jgi:hypothetical protein
MSNVATRDFSIVGEQIDDPTDATARTFLLFFIFRVIQLLEFTGNDLGTSDLRRTTALYSSTICLFVYYHGHVYIFCSR